MANEYLVRTPTSTGNRKIFTWAGWVKRATPGTRTWIFNTRNQAGTGDFFAFDFLASGDNDALRVNDSANTDDTNLKTTPSRRDPSSWMHLVLSIDTTKGIEQDRVNIYANGVQISDFTLSNYPTQNALMMVNSLNGMNIGTAIDGFGNPIFTFNGEMFDIFFIDGQALTPEVFGFYKDGNGYISAGSTQSTDFRNGQWVPRTPREIKNLINDNGGFGVNGFYLPMNDSSNFGADFHTTPNSIITLKGENLPQPRNGAPETTDAYVSQLRTDPYAANLVLAIPFISGGLGTDGTGGGINTGFGDYSHIINASQTTKDVQLITYNGTTPTIVSSENYPTNYYGSACYIDGNGSSHTGGHIRVVDDNIFDDLNLTTANWTIEGWFNPASRSTGGSNLFNFGDAIDYNQIQLILDPSGDIWHLWSYTGSAWDVNDAGTTARPPLNQWSHIAFEKVGTASDSYITTYVNGVAAKITAVPQNINYSSNPRLIIGGHYISGDSGGGDTYYYDGLISDVRMYNVAKYKGGFDVPKPYTPVGISTWRAVPDTCQNNFATWNPLMVSSNGTNTTYNQYVLTNGNLSAAPTENNHGVSANFSVSSGKWYWEVRVDTFYANNIWMGILDHNFGAGGTVPLPADSNYWYTAENAEILLYGSGGTLYRGSSNPATGTTYAANDIIGFGLDLETDGNTTPRLSFYKNGVLVTTSTGSMSGNPIGLWRPAVTFGGGGTDWLVTANFGQNPTFSGNITAGTYTDSNGKGLFKYQPPSGFLALCEDNLPTPTIKDPGEHFKTVLYTGDGNDGRSITGVGFQPDFVWIKTRVSGYHQLMDSVRGAGKQLYSNDAPAEAQGNFLTSFDNDGFSISWNNSGAVNASGTNYVAWCWKAGGPAVTNTDGSITSQVSVNQDAGFSIVSYTGNGSNGATVGHGLEKAPAFIISKNRDAANSWPTYHKSTSNSGDSATDVIYLNLSTTGSSDNIRNVNDTTFSTTSWGGINGNGDRHIAYCWTEIEGFSKFGSYVGNLSADGLFVYCGFKPAWVLIKLTTGTDHWFMCDSSRSSTNPVTHRLDASDSIAEITTFTSMDFLSNGFKLRTDNGQINNDGGTYIFAAFAESPFKTANAK